MKRVGGNKKHLIWAENDEFYNDEDEVLSRFEPLNPTNCGMKLRFSERDVAIFCDALKTM